MQAILNQTETKCVPGVHVPVLLDPTLNSLQRCQQSGREPGALPEGEAGHLRGPGVGGVGHKYTDG